MSISEKFFPLAELRDVLAAERAKQRRIALANGGFDLLHVGHVRYLREAKRLADILVVALNSDASLAALKGPERPIIGAEGRVMMISALSFVDYVTLFEEPTVDRVLQTLRPDLHCKGSDYSAETVPERETVLGYGGRIAIVGGDKVRSTSSIIAQIGSLEDEGA